MAELISGIKIKDRYTLKECKGSGSFGEVWLAHDEILDSNVAIKVYISLDHKGIEEFKAEYTTTLGLSHPNLLTTSYFDVWEQRPFLVMKYCSKGSVSAFATKMDEYDLWHFIHDVSAGLHYLHGLEEPIIHQDIKPDNILVDEDNRYLITDFGISKRVRSTMRKQSKRAVGAGATAYMGPERFESDSSPVKASDIWSLGVSIFELALGDLPFSGMGGGMQRNGAEMPSLGNKWSKELNMVMQSCLAKETWNRPTAEQLEVYSDAILKGKEAQVTWNMPSISHIPPQEPIGANETNEGSGCDEENIKASNKKRTMYVVGGIILAIILLILLWPSNRSRTAADPMPNPGGEIVENPVSSQSSKDTIKVPEVESKKEKTTVADSAPTKSQEEAKPSKKKEETKVDDKASQLKAALSSGNYEQVQKLANQGYAAAYGHLAKYYLKIHKYEEAEEYAIKAKNAGYSDGASVLKSLKGLGYYD